MKKAKGKKNQEKKEEINIFFWNEDIRADNFLSQGNMTHTLW
jgi:hypothetical protein